METLSKQNQDHSINDNDAFSSTLLLNNLLSIFSELLDQFVLIVVTSIEALFILQKCSTIFHFYVCSTFLLFFILKSHFSKSNPVYLVNFSCLKPPCFWRVPFSLFLENASMIELYDNKSLSFMEKVLACSGQSEETYLPPSLHYIPPKTHYRESIKEVHMVLFPIIDDLLAKTELSVSDIDILIVNCSGFCPSPSLSSIIINKYAMRSDIKSYNISGMGCSASALSINLAQNLLKVHKNSNVIILSAEILSTGWYSGHEQSKLILNCLFRMGSAAILLSNKKEAKKLAKYELFKTLRTQRASNDKGYYSAFREEDSNGKLGVTLRRDLLQVAGELIWSHIMVLGSSIFPVLEKLRHGVSIFRRRFVNKSEEIYVPNFKSVIQHFCLPTSGRAVIRESEAKDRVKKGHKVWQLGMGSGPKCNSVVLKCLRPIVGESKNGPWADCIHHYPIVSED